MVVNEDAVNILEVTDIYGSPMRIDKDIIIAWREDATIIFGPERRRHLVDGTKIFSKDGQVWFATESVERVDELMKEVV